MAISAKDAINKFNVRLLQKLPLDDEIFFGMAKEADLFPLGSGESIAAQPTRAKKVSHFLRHVVEPGAEEYLPRLLTDPIMLTLLYMSLVQPHLEYAKCYMVSNCFVLLSYLHLSYS